MAWKATRRLQYRVDDVKTEYSQDYVPLHPNLTKIVLAWSKQAVPTEEGWVFANPMTNRPYHPTEIQKRYRANIVAYSLAMLQEVTRRRRTSVNYTRIWASQSLDASLVEALEMIAAAVNDDITQPPAGISNISEWCKREGCWARLIEKSPEISSLLADEFWKSLSSAEDNQHQAKTARQDQKIEDGIGLQTRVLEIPPAQWTQILRK